jgi:hypothetical protein
MKIRGLLAGLLLAVVVTGCTGSPTAYEAPPTAPAFDGTPPPPPDTTTNRGGGGMGTGT